MNAPAYPWQNRQREAAMAICPDPLPCPFCGSTELLASEILDCTEGAEKALRSLRCWAETGQQFAIDWHRRWRVPLPDRSDD